MSRTGEYFKLVPWGAALAVVEVPPDERQCSSGEILTREQKAALSAIFAAGPGTSGAVLVTRNGAPEVIATVRSTEEYLELAGSGQLPQDHRVYLPSDA